MQRSKSNLLLDTHVWHWYAIGEKKLPLNIVKLIDEAGWESRLFISAISVWEIAMLTAKGRIFFSLPPETWIEQAITKSKIQLLELTNQVLIQSCFLPKFDHGDPADRMIVTTANLHNLPLLTADQKILDYARGGGVRALPCTIR